MHHHLLDPHAPSPKIYSTYFDTRVYTQLIQYQYSLVLHINTWYKKAYQVLVPYHMIRYTQIRPVQSGT